MDKNHNPPKDYIISSLISHANNNTSPCVGFNFMWVGPFGAMHPRRSPLSSHTIPFTQVNKFYLRNMLIYIKILLTDILLKSF